MKIKTHIILCAALLCCGGVIVSAQEKDGQNVVNGVDVSDVQIERNGKFLDISMIMNLEDLPDNTNRAILITPVLVGSSDTLSLHSVGVYGRMRYYYYLRQNDGMLSGEEEMSYMASKAPDSVEYHHIVDYQPWMNGAELVIHRGDYGCCNTLLDEESGTAGSHSEEFFPTLVYIHPEGVTEKSRAIEGSAFIDFPVDKTDIYPDYRNNRNEFGKIQASLDSVKNDKDIVIDSVWLKGFASPESPYSHNTDLAIGRTEAIKQYISRLYDFEDDVVTTEYEPEDWAGLRRYVENSNLEHRSEILEIIDSDLEPDPKEAKIKRTYPSEYKFLLDNCYPALRHTDYRIFYTVRSYTDIDEILRQLEERPQNLDLNEFYLASQQYEPGSEGFTNVFETAVRMYPNDETANLNAANAAMRRGDLSGAERYLKKAGDTPEAVYARGALAILRKDYDTARKYMNEAAEMGLDQAKETLGQLNLGRR